MLRRLDTWRFAARRAEYFEYLHAILQGARGGLTLRDLFDRDARRYGASPRGRLSRYWARTCEAGGGDLYVTWRGSFPADELALVRAAQAHGNDRLLECFQALAAHLALLAQAQRVLWSTLGAAAVAVLLASLLLLALPAWTVPALQQAFQGLPQPYVGGWSRALFEGARLLRDWGFLLPLLAVAAAVTGFRGLPRACGPWRRHLDRHGPWRLYRDVQALRLLSLAAILLRPGTGVTTQLRPVMVLFLEQATPWLATHLRAIVRRLDQGQTDATAFGTGLLDRDVYWYLQDMAVARGLPQAISLAHARMAGVWLARIRAQALVLRWCVLLAGLAFILGTALWHYTAIDELRRGWMMFHAGQ